MVNCIRTVSGRDVFTLHIFKGDGTYLVYNLYYNISFIYSDSYYYEPFFSISLLNPCLDVVLNIVSDPISENASCHSRLKLTLLLLKAANYLMSQAMSHPYLQISQSIALTSQAQLAIMRQL